MQIPRIQTTDKQAAKIQKIKKSAGCDGVAVEVIKKHLKQSTKKFVNIFNNISETADVPENYPKHLKRSKDYHETYHQWPCSQR